MRYGLSIPNFAEPGALVDVARATEANGWDGFFLWDHILVDRTAAVPVSEPWTVLAAAATATTRVRLGTMVTPVARRRPWVLARQVTTVDHLSHGRTVLGVGLGVPPDAEYGAFGESASPRDHAALLDEGSPSSTRCGGAVRSTMTDRAITSRVSGSRRGRCSGPECRCGRRVRCPRGPAPSAPLAGTASCPCTPPRRSFAL